MTNSQWTSLVCKKSYSKNDGLMLLSCFMFHQLVTSVPTKTLPKSLTLGTVTNKEIAIIENKELAAEEDLADRGQILWIRGLSRLQYQVCYYLLFNLDALSQSKCSRPFGRNKM